MDYKGALKESFGSNGAFFFYFDRCESFTYALGKNDQKEPYDYVTFIIFQLYPNESYKKLIHRK